MTSKLIPIFVLLASIFFLVQCNQPKVTKSIEKTAISKDSIIQQGAYLVTILGCNDCHSSKRMGVQGPELIPELMLSGFQSTNQLPPIPTDALKNGWSLFYPDLTAAVGPWGVSFAANLTPDETGIGNWSLEQFKIAIKKGKSKGLENGRPLLPPMPTQNYAHMKNEDVEAIYAYLMNIKPVKNIVPASIAPDSLK